MSAQVLQHHLDAARREEMERRGYATDPGETSYVYFIRSGRLTKIGLAADPDRRLRTLQMGSAAKLRMVATYRGDAEFEAVLHHEFAEHRRHGEWFELPRGYEERVHYHAMKRLLEEGR